ncbi:DUF2007 domain-containing protein [Olivibacter sitiensis]|uniref:putative signal transducing protein n=1 Tax=Olivibacter sitiensis TaxID=376470 RepID=UPI000402D028|nr:DUF2007 domain-containing protein [Olivibacter sitiensis]
MEKDWIKLFTGTDFFKAEIARQALEEAGIHAVLLNKKDSSYGFGQVELWVHESNKAFAEEVLNEMEEGNEN